MGGTSNQDLSPVVWVKGLQVLAGEFSTPSLHVIAMVWRVVVGTLGKCEPVVTANRRVVGRNGGDMVLYSPF